MTVKTNGAEFKAFYKDPEFWPESTWHEDDYMTLDGVDIEDLDLDAIKDDAKITISGGVVWDSPNGDHDIGSFESYFKKWRKKQTTVYLSVEVHKDKEEAVKAAIKAAGGKVA